MVRLVFGLELVLCQSFHRVKFRFFGLGSWLVLFLMLRVGLRLGLG
jgi:hypothetical protein